MRRLLLLSVLGAAGAGCEAPSPAAVQAIQQPVVYGEDDRLDVYAHPDEAVRTLARQSIMAVIAWDRIDQSDPAGFTFGERLLGASLNLCEGERFVDQVRASNCSATLIGPRMAITAGHCVEPDECPDYAFIFDRFYRAEGELEVVTAEDVYPCRRVVAWEDSADGDYAIIELDRRVSPDRVPAPVLAIEPLPVDTPLTMIGFPNGLPAKIDTGGRVILPGEAPWIRFEATVDAFGGNSGSGVFNDDGVLVGILEGGRRDYADEGECRVVNRLPDDVDDAENLVYVGRALDAFCAAEPRADLCEPGVIDGRSWCDACADDADCRADWICDGTCRAPCVDDTACRSDHRCVEGRCAPDTRTECRADTVWAVPACAPAVQQADCGPEQICALGECRVPSPGDRCANAIEIPPERAVYEGQTTDGIFNAYEGDCGGRGSEVVYTFTVDAPARLIASATGFDTLLYLRRDCDPEQEIACNDDRARGEPHALLRAELDPGTYHLFMDGYRRDGVYALEVDFRAPCPPGCDPGAQRCVDDSASVCERDADDCPMWSDPMPCADGCVDGACLMPDAGLMDGGLMDGGLMDAGPMDGGLMDAGLMDAGLMDAMLDAAVDATPDATQDAAVDAANDATPDATPDADPDALPDALPDAQIVDAQIVDAQRPDAQVDMRPDASAPDAAIDQGPPEAASSDDGCAIGSTAPSRAPAGWLLFAALMGWRRRSS